MVDPAPPASAGTDAGPDAGLADAGNIDAGLADGGNPDAGLSDAGVADAGPGASLPPVDPGLLPATATGWSPFAARPASAPATSFASGYVLNVAGNGVASEYGGWTTRVSALQGSAWYRFTARATPRSVVSLRESVTIVLRWSGAFGEEVAPDYIWDFTPQADGSLIFDRTIQTPPGTTAVDVQLILQWCPMGSCRSIS